MLLQSTLIFITSLILIGLVKKYALNLGLIDKPNKRSVHINPIARGAGIGFYLAVLIVLPMFNISSLLLYKYTYIATFIIFIAGVLDDYRGITFNFKFFVIIVSTILLSFDNIIISTLGIYFSFELSLGWFALPFTIFAVVGFTNALNLIDGLDGLASSISIVILISFFTIGYYHNDIFMQLLSLAFIATLLAFLFYNWYPASIFMGDSGSLILGFIISILAIKSLEYIPTTAILFIAAVPILDTIVVMIRRKKNGRSMFLADRCHIHHIIKKLFNDNTKVAVGFLICIQILYSLFGLSVFNGINEFYLLSFFILNILLQYYILSLLIKKLNIECKS